MSERSPVRSGKERERTSPITFYRQVIAELRKVVWPTQQQLVTYLIVVLVFVLVMIATCRCWTWRSARPCSRSSAASSTAAARGGRDES